MTTPKEYAEDFARLWTMEDSMDSAQKERARLRYEEAKEQGDLKGRTLVDFEVYVRGEDKLDRMRGKGRHLKDVTDSEYGQIVLQKLGEILEGTYITEPGKEYLNETFIIAMPLGYSPTLALPLDYIGIDINDEKLGIFDPNADLKSIEGKLLEYNSIVLKAKVDIGIFPHDVISHDRDLNTRWKEAYNQRYQTTGPNP